MMKSVCIVLSTALAVAAQTPEAAEILNHNCAACHNSATRTSGLNVLSGETLLAGGNRRPAIVPGNPAQSLLIKAVKQTGALKMPPGGKLSAADIAILEQWISSGAKFASKDTAPVAALRHWAFRPVRRPVPPTTRDTKWPRNDIDRFVLARLERERIQPSLAADEATLLRRVYLDLTGIPPTPEQTNAYLADHNPDRYEKLVYTLLASPHYGERWGRHWLDEARYADSDGGSRDEPREMWLYRDWVLNAFNNDMPFNEFVVEQLAGDLLPDATPQQIIATGFNRNAPLQIEAGTDREEYRVEAVDDRVDTIGTVFLGLTVGCARCHDHKYDPISQREYYQLFAFFNNVDEYSNDVPAYSDTNDIQVTHAPLLPIGPEDQVQKWTAIQAQLLALYRERFEYHGGEAGLHKGSPEDKIRNATIDYLKRQLPNLPVGMVMHDMETPRQAHILLVGDFANPGAPVEPGVLHILNPLPPRADHKPFNRLDLAKWMVDPANPLVSRVRVNRIWQQFFGLGLVATENDFGTKGEEPSHPELLDWLASQFVEHGWSQKYLVRQIVMSATYRQGSAVRPELQTRDPKNRLLARQTRIRLDAEIVRDEGLVAGGLLNPKVGGPSVYPPQPDGVMQTGQVVQKWNTSEDADRYRRGLYTFYYRVTPNPYLKVFDGGSGLLACTRRARTDTPLQALTLLNDPNFQEMAQHFARRVIARRAPERIDFAFETAYTRAPSPQERARIERLLSVEKDAFQTAPSEAAQIAGKGATADLAAWTSVCRVLLNTDEFVTRE